MRKFTISLYIYINRSIYIIAVRKWLKKWNNNQILIDFIIYVFILYSFRCNRVCPISESMNYARAVSQICDDHLMTQFLTGQRYTNTSIYDDLRKVSERQKFNLTFSDLMWSCYFRLLQILMKPHAIVSFKARSHNANNFSVRYGLMKDSVLHSIY